LTDKAHFQRWLEELIAEGRAFRREGDHHYEYPAVNGWRVKAEHLLTELVGTANPYYIRFNELLDKDKNGYIDFVDSAVAIMEAVYHDLLAERLRSFRSMVEAEVFADFLDMAAHILANGFYGAAAALMGGVLERGLQDIAQARGVPLGAKGDLPALNARLAQAGVYNAMRQKEVQYFIDVRNKAAHGEFDQFTADDAGKMISGVRELLANHMP
jgi:hypothetical protein